MRGENCKQNKQTKYVQNFEEDVDRTVETVGQKVCQQRDYTMSHQNPYCQMCKKELCVVCKQQLDNCKCPCPNFVICRYCEAHEKTLPPCDEIFPATCNTGVSGGGGGGIGGSFGGGGPISKMMPLFMMMMMNANKQGGSKSCDCSRGSHNRKRDRDYPPRKDCESPLSAHPCCCKTGQSKPMPNCSQPVVVLNPCPPNTCLSNPCPPNPCQPKPYPPNPRPQSCCTCSSRGDAHNGKCREPINQYFFGSDCNPQLTAQPAAYSSYPSQPQEGYWDRTPAYQPQKMNQPNVERKVQYEESSVPVKPNGARQTDNIDPPTQVSPTQGSPTQVSPTQGSPTRGSPGRRSPARGSPARGTLQYGPRKPGSRKKDNTVVNKV